MIRAIFSHGSMLAYFNTHPWPDAALVVGSIVVVGLVIMVIGRSDP